MTETVVTSAILGGFGLAITAYYNYFNSKLAHDKMGKDLFKEFNERYDKLNEWLVEIDSKCKTLQELEENPFLKNKLNDFFNLCAEEYYWYRKGRIEKDIWRSWHAGMNDWFNRVSVIREAWKKEMECFGYMSYYIQKRNDFFTNA